MRGENGYLLGLDLPTPVVQPPVCSLLKKTFSFHYWFLFTFQIKRAPELMTPTKRDCISTKFKYRMEHMQRDESNQS